MAPATFTAVLVLQFAVILAAAHAAGWLFRRFLGQPRVVGEMTAGILLGPSLFGLLAPDLQGRPVPRRDARRPPPRRPAGVGLYMFLVGLGFDRGHLRRQAAGAGAFAAAGMMVPFLAAAALAPWLLARPGLFADHLDLAQATLFLGASLAITAFPVLARILDERGLTETPLGALSLSAGALGDVGAWILLALVLATVGGGGGVPDLGLYAVFGGFAAGLVVPRGPVARRLKAGLEPIVAAALVPVFFAVSGLNTRLDLATDPALAAVAAVVLLAAVGSKVGGGWLAARLTGHDNPTALAVGVLINTRGLMELVVLNIGLQAGLIQPALFSILVLMALVTTFMAAPLFRAAYGRRAGALAPPDASGAAGRLGRLGLAVGRGRRAT
ncbi:cation:proton antiporter [Phenylobacterium sp. J426]|uniref:cation:proton antiporter domain-containing protein n=1 Tax=Phenylobacterium sp. J426 TaxID=2898439 RepID=UPI00215172D4|nr:cation:proton antiporter [Phenylobacterium sp. J426]MCR5872909.1 cation:proton antiporter [Phenylobacterium sp. J426]